MPSVHLSGMASLSSRYLTALSRCRPPVRAAVSKALGRKPAPLMGDDADDDCCCCCCWASKEGKDKSVEDDENVCENQPDNLVGRSPILFPPLGEAYNPGDGVESEMGLSERVRGRGKGLRAVGRGTGSIITGRSSASPSSSSVGKASSIFEVAVVVMGRGGTGTGFSSPRGSLNPPNRLFLDFSLLMLLLPWLSSRSRLPPEELLAILAVLPASRWPFPFWRNLGNLEGCEVDVDGDDGAGGDMRLDLDAIVAVVSVVVGTVGASRDNRFPCLKPSSFIQSNP